MTPPAARIFAWPTQSSRSIRPGRPGRHRPTLLPRRSTGRSGRNARCRGHAGGLHSACRYRMRLRSSALPPIGAARPVGLTPPRTGFRPAAGMAPAAPVRPDGWPGSCGEDLFGIEAPAPPPAGEAPGMAKLAKQPAPLARLQCGDLIEMIEAERIQLRLDVGINAIDPVRSSGCPCRGAERPVIACSTGSAGPKPWLPPSWAPPEPRPTVSCTAPRQRLESERVPARNRGQFGHDPRCGRPGQSGFACLPAARSIPASRHPMR